VESVGSRRLPLLLGLRLSSPRFPLRRAELRVKLIAQAGQLPLDIESNPSVTSLHSLGSGDGLSLSFWPVRGPQRQLEILNDRPAPAACWAA